MAHWTPSRQSLPVPGPPHSIFRLAEVIKNPVKGLPQRSTRDILCEKRTQTQRQPHLAAVGLTVWQTVDGSQAEKRPASHQIGIAQRLVFSSCEPFTEPTEAMIVLALNILAYSYSQTLLPVVVSITSLLKAYKLI